MEQDLRAKIIARAWKDEAFRKTLLTNPREALKEFGIDVPKNVDLKVLTEDPTHAYFVLPPSPTGIKEMAEDELEKIAAAKDECVQFWIIEFYTNKGPKSGTLMG